MSVPCNGAAALVAQWPAPPLGRSCQHAVELAVGSGAGVEGRTFGLGPLAFGLALSSGARHQGRGACVCLLLAQPPPPPPALPHQAQQHRRCRSSSVGPCIPCPRSSGLVPVIRSAVQDVLRRSHNCLGVSSSTYMSVGLCVLLLQVCCRSYCLCISVSIHQYFCSPQDCGPVHLLSRQQDLRSL